MSPTSPWIERLSRVGILAKAVIYLIIGLLATGVALNLGGALTGSRGVLHLLLDQPLGRAILALLAFGLAAYTLWLFVQAFVDPDGNGTSFVGLVNRAGQLITGAAHGALTAEAVCLAAGLPGFVGGGVEALIGRLFRAPHGVWVVGLAGVVVVVLGVIQIWRGLRGNVRRDWQLRALDPVKNRWQIRLGRFGLGVRGLVLAIAGALVIRAARVLDPERAGGIEDVLRALQRQPASDWLLGTVALGLVAYGLFALIEARYRFIPSA
ncbi:MAG: DUF1206 domain-containing protein [Gemmatimonadales bacterium]|nr:DUF1206 domain-containing protein [Gemmatimonadales bacterium]